MGVTATSGILLPMIQKRWWHSAVRSREFYANSISFGVSKQNITKLQRAHNILARVVTLSSRYDSATIQLQKLHSLAKDFF